MIAPEIVVGLLSLAGTLVGSMAGIMTANRLTTYRIGELEKKVDKHNNVLERVALLERDEKTQWRRIDEILENMEKLRDDGK